jgi:hypothetical protein
MHVTSRSVAAAGRVVLLGLLVVACSAPGGAGSATPTVSSGPTSTPVPSFIAAADAAAIVLAQDPRFAGIGARDQGLVGQGSWYEVTPDAAGWRVTVQLGWGDCPAGCINRHTWEYVVGFDGAASRTGETGDQLPAASGPPASEPVARSQPAPSSQPVASARPAPTARPTPTRQPAPSVTPTPTGDGSNVPPVSIPSIGGPWLVGVATAGPVCPVERYPPDPACAPRPVVGATIAVLDPGGREVASAITGADGTYRVAVPAGSVRVQAAPVAGLMRMPAPIDVVVPAGPGAWLRVDLAYDTGIR